MAKKTKTRDVTIVGDEGEFIPFFKKIGSEKKDYDFDGISSLRKLLSNEKARLLHVVKTKNPGSVYELAKILGRDFKSVCNDIILLDRFGLIELIAEKTGNRLRHRPVIVVDTLNINLKI
jgi:predicted transcriptional regulator